MASRTPRVPMQAQCRVCEEWRTVRMQAGDKPAARCRSCAAANRSVMDADVVRLITGQPPEQFSVYARLRAVQELTSRAAAIQASLDEPKHERKQ